MLLFPDGYFYIAIVLPSYLQWGFCIIDVLIAYIFASAVVNLRICVFVDIQCDKQTTAFA